MKIIITEKIHQSGIEFLKEQFDVTEMYDPGKERLLEVIKDYDAIIQRASIDLDKEMIDAATNLKVIGMAGVGLNNIDVAYAKSKGIPVFNVPDGSTNAVAELTFSLLLNVARKITPANDFVKGGGWNKHLFPGSELKNKTIGTIGFGRIGKRVGKIADAFDMNVIAYDPYIDPKDVAHMNVRLVSFEKLLTEADIISIHCPITEETHHLISEEEFQLMKDGAILLNMGRGGIVSEKAAIEALKSKKLKAYAMDVVENEPYTGGTYQSELLNFDNVVITPHIGAGTEEAQEYIAKTVTKKVASYLLGEGVFN